MGEAVRARDFKVLVDGERNRFMDITDADYHRDYMDDEEQSEYFVPVEWIDTRPVNEAVSETGFFGNQNTVCRPRTSKWEHTVDRLKQYFHVDDNSVSYAKRG